MNRRERRAVLNRYRRRPDLFAREILGVELWSKQTEVCCSVRDNRRTAVRSCHGVGKTFTAAVVVLWFLYCHPGSRVVTTAPIFDQVKLLLWAEINALHARAADRGIPLGGSPNLTSLHLAPDWFAVGLSTNKPTRFQGHHAEHLLLVCDEASGIPQEIYDAAEGFLTSDMARVLLIGNPNEAAGQFFEAFTKEARLWHQVHVSAFDLPTMTAEAIDAAEAEFPGLKAYMAQHGLKPSTERVPDSLLRRLTRPKWVAEMLAKWSAGSPLWQVRVLGDFPSTTDNTVVGINQVEAAQARVYEPKPGDPVVVSCDVARFGSDETVIGIRVGMRYRQVRAYYGKATTETAGYVLDAAAEWEKANPELPVTYIVIDDSGVGGGVTDMVEESDYDVRPFNSSHKPRDKKHYRNARSEAWFHFAEQLPEADLDSDAQLLADLVSPTYKMHRKGQRVVEEKEVTKARLKRSPDRADCCLMAFYPVADRGTVHTPESIYQ